MVMILLSEGCGLSVYALQRTTAPTTVVGGRTSCRQPVLASLGLPWAAAPKAPATDHLPTAVWLHTPSLLFLHFHLQGFIYLEEKHYNIEKCSPDMFMPVSFLYKKGKGLAFSHHLY